ncbi:UvrD-helicase domain-containing protein [Komagataeibacter nataicola]|nr:UvrD-helicase domain-containing protein [Komagataeibacter nataicola]WEQ55012.1 UvrD-helicase domain-containing protein [Komagataeibacter nataicola]
MIWGFQKLRSGFLARARALAIYSRVVNSGAPLADMLLKHYPWCAGWEAQLKQLFAGYVTAKQEQGVLDYDDLLLCWAQMVSAPVLAADIGSKWDHVLVDEYQDTNRLQADILLGMKPDGRGLTVVGDDAQSIYAFSSCVVARRYDRNLRSLHPTKRQSFPAPDHLSNTHIKRSPRTAPRNRRLTCQMQKISVFEIDEEKTSPRIFQKVSKRVEITVTWVIRNSQDITVDLHKT